MELFAIIVIVGGIWLLVRLRKASQNAPSQPGRSLVPDPVTAETEKRAAGPSAKGGKMLSPPTQSPPTQSPPQQDQTAAAGPEAGSRHYVGQAEKVTLGAARNLTQAAQIGRAHV